MKKITLLLLAIAFGSFSLNAQTYLSEGFESGVPPTGWLDEAGSQDFAGNLWAQTNARSNSGANSAFYDDYNVTDPFNNDRWFITEVMDLSTATTPELIYFDNVNDIGFAGIHAVKYSTNYSGSGDPTAATWTDINTTIGTEDTWVQNGPYALPTNATVYVAFQYVGDFAAEWYIDDIVVREPLTCTPPTATAAVMDDCANSQFSVDVVVTNMGDAAGYTLTNNYDAGSVSVTGNGTWTAGPFPAGTIVAVTLEHDSDSDCNLTLSNNKDYCLDGACNALPVAIDSGTSGGFYSNVSATPETSEVFGTCWVAGAASESLWFKFVAPASGQVRISTKIGDGTLTDTQIALYSVGDCSNFATYTEIACDDDDDNDVLGAGGFEALIQVTGLVAAGTYYVQVDGYQNDVGTFDLSIFDLQTLSVEDVKVVEPTALSYFPNPVTNKLTLKARQNIQNVSVFNMLGQEVMRTEMNLQRGELDMSSLQSGPYFVKVSINDTIETIKIIKK